MVVNRIVENLILPPGGLLLLLVLGLLVARRWSGLSRVLVWSAAVGLYAVSNPFLVSKAMGGLEFYPPLDVSTVSGSGAEVIVVLSGSLYSHAPEYGRDTVGDSTLRRLRYGVYLHRRTGLPLLVSGGRTVDRDVETLARVMADVLADEYGIGDVWLEPMSRNTWENAVFSQALLEEKGIGKAILVTDASHMVRAVEAFEHAGLEVVPASTAYRATVGDRAWFEAWLPTRDAFDMSVATAHEWVGLVWYRLRYY